jgi:hypothetical protein
MNMNRHMLIWFFISMLVDRRKEWNSYKMEEVIRKGESLIRFENEVIIF